MLCNNNEPFLDQIGMCNEKWTLPNSQSWPAQWLDWEEAPKYFPKPNLPHGRSRSLFGGLLSILSTTAFWILVYIWEVCSASQRNAPKSARPVAGIGGQNGPNTSPQQCPVTYCTTNASKVEQIGLWNFGSSAIFTWPLANWLPLHQAPWQFFAGKTLPQLAGGRKWLSKSLLKTNTWIFTLQE